MSDDSRLLRFRRRLNRPVDAASLGAFRIVFGACVAWDAAKMLITNQLFAQYVAPPFHFSFELAPVPVLPGPWLNTSFVLLAVAGGLLACGLFTRTAAVVVCAGLTYWFLLDEAAYLNHRYLMCLIAFLLIWTPCGRAFSIDLLRRRPARRSVPFWPVFLLRMQLLVVYVFAGVAKLNADWLRGAPLDMWLAEQTGFPLIGPFVDERWMVLAIAWGGMLFDLSIGWLLLWRRTRAMALAAAALFHACNHFWFDIGVFPVLAMGASLIFCEPDWPRRLGAALRRMSGWRAVADRDAPADAEDRVSAGESSSVESHPRPVAPLATAGILIWLTVQVLLPLRHWLYPGHVDWTEEGHRFSWQMMLRDKGYELQAIFVVRNDSELIEDYAATTSSRDPDAFAARTETGSWQLQPVADPLPPLYPLPLPLQAAFDAEWAEVVERSELDRLMIEMLSPREQLLLGIDPADYDEMHSATGDDATLKRMRELDRALTHRALWGIVQHARRMTEARPLPGRIEGSGEQQSLLLQNLRSVARQVFAEVALEVPDRQVDRLLVGADEFGRLRLAGYQVGPMLTRPYMLRQYAHHVAERLERVWGVRPQVFVDLQVSLNMRPFARIVDPGADLASQPFSLGHAAWIEPLDVPLPSFEERRRRRESLDQSGYFVE